MRSPRSRTLSAVCLLLLLGAGGPSRAEEPVWLPPGQSEASSERMKSVATELKRIADAHGPDAVILQAKLLMRTIAAGAQAASEVRVAGAVERDGTDYLSFEVLTGLLFEAETTSPGSRAADVWSKVAGPALEEMGSFSMAPPALELVLHYAAQSTRKMADGRVDPAAPAEPASLIIRIPAQALVDLADHTVTLDGLRRVSSAHSGDRPLEGWGASGH